MSDPTKPTYDWSNPFLRNMPMVAIVRQRGIKNTHNVISDETQTKRVFFRIGNNMVTPLITDKIEITPSNTTLDTRLGFDKLHPF